MKPEKRQLIHNLLDEQRDARREATLAAGARVLRRRRWMRRAFQGLAAMTLLASAVLVSRLVAPRPIQTAIVSPASTPQSLTDAALLDLFPDTPVGLITLADGRKRLVFLRPGDEERFVKRL